MCKRFADIPAEHKLPAQLFHRLTNDHAHRRLTDPLHGGSQGVDDPAREIRVQQFSGQQQGPR